MPLSTDEQERIRQEFADDPRRGQVEQAAAERLAATEHGQDTAAPDKRLAGFGYETDGQRAEAKAAAAAARKAAAKPDKRTEQADTPAGGEDQADKGKGPAPAQTGTRARSTRAGHASGGKGDS